MHLAQNMQVSTSPGSKTTFAGYVPPPTITIFCFLAAMDNDEISKIRDRVEERKRNDGCHLSTARDADLYVDETRL